MSVRCEYSGEGFLQYVYVYCFFCGSKVQFMVKRFNRFSIILKSFFIISDAVHVRSKRLATKLKTIKFRNRKNKTYQIYPRFFFTSPYSFRYWNQFSLNSLGEKDMLSKISCNLTGNYILMIDVSTLSEPVLHFKMTKDLS